MKLEAESGGEAVGYSDAPVGECVEHFAKGGVFTTDPRQVLEAALTKGQHKRVKFGADHAWCPQGVHGHPSRST